MEYSYQMNTDSLEMEASSAIYLSSHGYHNSKRRLLPITFLFVIEVHSYLQFLGHAQITSV